MIKITLIHILALYWINKFSKLNSSKLADIIILKIHFGYQCLNDIKNRFNSYIKLKFKQINKKLSRDSEVMTNHVIKSKIKLNGIDTDIIRSKKYELIKRFGFCGVVDKDQKVEKLPCLKHALTAS